MGYMTSRAMPVQPMMSMGYAPAPPVYHFPQSLSAAPSQQVPALFTYALQLQMQKRAVFVECALALTCTYAHCPYDCCKHVGSAKTTVRGKQSTSCDSMYMTTVHTFVGYTMIAPWWYHFGKGPCTGSAAKMQHVPSRHAGI